GHARERRLTLLEPKHRLYFTILVAAAAFAAALMVTALVHVPVPWYFPLRGDWQIVVKPDALAVDWYGRNLLAFTVAAVLGTVTWLTCGALRSPANERPF